MGASLLLATKAFSMDNNFKDKFPQAKSFDEFRREISILELALAHGYILEHKKGLRTPVLFNPTYQDRIVIMDPKNPANQGYWNPEDDADKGSLIQFVKKRLGSIFPQDNQLSVHSNVNKVLYQYLRLDPFVRQRNRQLINYEALEEQQSGAFSVASYQLKPLVQTNFITSRYIASETTKLPEFAGRIFNSLHQDPKNPGLKYTNTVFPYYVADHNQVVGLEIRNITYKSHAEGSDRSHGVWHSNIPTRLERIVLVESALDALAHKELKQQTNNLYVSYGGNLSLNQIKTIMALKNKGQVGRNFQFVSASDNDKKGAYYDLLFIRAVAAPMLPSLRLASPGRIKLAFSPGPGLDQQYLITFAGSLSEKLRNYNDRFEKEAGSEQDTAAGKIKLELEAGQLLVEVPHCFSALNTFNHQFIVAAGLEYEVRIDKAFLNDYNDDLKLIKLINSHKTLLAEFNKNDLRRKPDVPLQYLDLKFVLLQPGRYQQLVKTFQLVKSKEEDNPVFSFPAAGAQPEPAAPVRKRSRKKPA